MSIQVLMPALSPTMTEGNLVRWVKKEGDTVKSGDVIAEIETDKATMEVEATDDGTLGKILVAEGTQAVKVNTPIAVLLEEGESADAPVAAAPAATKKEEAEEVLVLSNPIPEAPSSLTAPSSVEGDRLKISPLARRVAEQAGISLSSIAGTGPNGRVILADVERALASRKGGATKSKLMNIATPSTLTAPSAQPRPSLAATLAAPSAAPASSAQGIDARDYADKLGLAYEAVPNNAVRKIIAKRLTESKQLVPHFYLSVDCELDALLSLRKGVNKAKDSKVSVNDCIIRAVALALRKVPEANASWTDEASLRYTSVDVSVAVASPSGLVTPIIKAADEKTLLEISTEMKDLAGRAREGKLRPEEFQGGGFTISNLGMFGVKTFSAIINPPQACILAVGAGEQRPVVKEGALAIATVMTVTLSVDHRVVDGSVGAEFLAAFKELIEYPAGLLV